MAHFYLGEYVWDTTSAKFPHWRSPGDFVASIDLRPLGAQAAVGGVPSGVGFFALSSRLSASEELTWQYLGQDPDRNLTLTQRTAWRTRVGLTQTPSATQLNQIVYQTLTSLADPSGAVTCPPILPDRRGILRAVLAEREFTRRLLVGDDEWPAVLDRLQRDYRRIRELVLAGQAAMNQHRKFLRVLTRKFQLQDSDYTLFIPGDLPDETPIEPTTTLTESFNKADNGLGPDLTWTVLEGTWSVITNRAQNQMQNVFSTARADSDLSSTDHYCQFIFVSDAAAFDCGPVCRKDGTATMTFYFVEGNYVSGGSWNLWKQIAGSNTMIAGTTTSAIANNDVLEIEANGSTIRSLNNGSQINTATDTAITTGLRCGMTAFQNAADMLKSNIDSWEAGDLGGAAFVFQAARARNSNVFMPMMGR